MHNVFSDDDVLRESFYREPSEPETARAKRPPQPKADHYRVICISLYNEDLDRLDAMVDDLKQRGHRKMNRSALIRFALDHVELSEIPKSY
jgi:hypothetical protein